VNAAFLSGQTHAEPPPGKKQSLNKEAI
jgi:hypothetical protein